MGSASPGVTSQSQMEMLWSLTYSSVLTILIYHFQQNCLFQLNHAVGMSLWVLCHLCSISGSIQTQKNWRKKVPGDSNFFSAQTFFLDPFKLEHLSASLLNYFKTFPCQLRGYFNRNPTLLSLAKLNSSLFCT